MDITKLYTKPDGTVTAAQLSDGSESYPVLIEALGNTVYLPELLKSGWQLDALPLKLSKNGMPLENLPKAVWTPSMEAQYGQDMYDTLGTEMPVEERKKYLFKGGQTNNFPVLTRYAYNTREEFLAYLDSIKDNVPDEDYLPLNCLVAPHARFSLDEFVSSKNRVYTQIIAARRRLSYVRYTKLCAYLLKHGMPEQYNAQEFLKAYLQWGVDGVQFAYTGAPSIESSILTMGAYGQEAGYSEQVLMPNTEQVYALLVKTNEGYDVMCPPGIQKNELWHGGQITPYDAFRDREQVATHMFEITSMESERAAALKPGQAIAIRRRVRRPSYKWEVNPVGSSSVDIIRISFNHFEFGQALTTHGFSFVTSANTPMPADYIGHPDKAADSGFAMAIANSIVDRRKKPSNRTAFAALQECGFSLVSSLAYFCTRYSIGVPGKPSAISDDSDGLSEKEYIPGFSENTFVTLAKALANPDDYDDIVADLPISEVYGETTLDDAQQTAIETLRGIVDGVTNDPDLTAAIADEDRVKPDMYYDMFRAITSCTSTTTKDIHAQVKNWTPGKPVVVNAGGVSLSAQGYMLQAIEHAYKNFKCSVRLYQARNAFFYIWVDGAIRELGDPDRGNHIGFYATVIDMRKQKAIEARNAFALKYADMVVESLETMKMADPVRWNTTMDTFLGNPMASAPIDFSKSTRMSRTTGIAEYVGATMLCQAIKQGMCRVPLPTGEVTLKMSEHEELRAYVDYCKAKCIMNMDRRAFYCDCQTFCDNIVSLVPGDDTCYFYPVNAIVTPNKVLPRPGLAVPEFDGVFSWNYTTFCSIFENAGTPEKMPHPSQRAFFALNELQSRDETNDLLYALLTGHITGKQSYLRQYYKQALDVTGEWRTNNPDTHLNGLTGPWTAVWNMEGVTPISTGQQEPPNNGRPCWKPYNELKVLKASKVSVEEAVQYIKPYRGLTADEYAAGVMDIQLPQRAGKFGFLTVEGNFIGVYSNDKNVEPLSINAGDVAYLDPTKYPVAHIYGNRWVIRVADGTLYSVEV